MTCEQVRAEITAYLGGELDDTTASSLRGHLRLCDACRALADDHARIADALGALPAPEPKDERAMWAGVKARLAAAEIEDAGRGRLSLLWRRLRPQLVPALALAAAAAVAVVWIERRRGHDDDGAIAGAPPPPAAPVHKQATPPPPAPSPTGDVVDDLSSDDAKADASYRAAADELLATIADVRGEWSPSQAKAFDARVAALRANVDHAALGLPRERAWQALIDYVQRAVVGVRVAEAQ
jgi:hypothetical protein